MTWKTWTGGDTPTGQVDIRLRSGREVLNTAARKWLWGRPRREDDLPAGDNDNNGGVIVAYREMGEAA